MATLVAAPQTAEVVGMWVSPAARRRGLGERLLEAVAARARELGHARLRLTVAESNPPARRLYERCGFRPTGEIASLPRDPSLKALVMERLSSERG